MTDFVAAATLDQVPPGCATTVSVNGNDVALFNFNGTVCALRDSCAHAGASLGSGEFSGKTVRCRAHGWKYDVTTGFANGIEGFGVPAYPVKIVDGTILVAVG
jgi:nitrite reductase/ring-hydroxylating ferredoxin subunit